MNFNPLFIQQILVAIITTSIFIFWVCLSVIVISAYAGSERYARANLHGLGQIWKAFSAYLISFCVVAFFISINGSGELRFTIAFFDFVGPVGGIVLWMISYFTASLGLAMTTLYSPSVMRRSSDIQS